MQAKAPGSYLRLQRLGAHSAVTLHNYLPTQLHCTQAKLKRREASCIILAVLWSMQGNKSWEQETRARSWTMGPVAMSPTPESNISSNLGPLSPRLSEIEGLEPKDYHKIRNPEFKIPYPSSRLLPQVHSLTPSNLLLNPNNSL